MGKGLIISVLLHSMLVSLFFVSGVVLRRDPPAVPAGPIPVNIKTIEEFNRIKAGNKNAKAENQNADKKGADRKEEKNKKKPTPKAAREATVKKKEVEKKSRPAKAKPKKITKRKKPKKKKPAEKKKNKDARKAKKDFNPDQMAALLNKLPSERKKEQEKQAKKKSKKQEKSFGDERGNDVVMTANEIGYIRSRMSQCWKVQSGGLGSESFVIKLHVSLKKDGTLLKKPVVTNPSSSPFFRVAMESAVRAAIECQPYRLPVSRYKGWKEFIMVLDPRDMHSG